MQKYASTGVAFRTYIVFTSVQHEKLTQHDRVVSTVKVISVMSLIRMMKIA